MGGIATVGGGSAGIPVLDAEQSVKPAPTIEATYTHLKNHPYWVDAK
jgi:hypothetical protein